MILYRSFSVLVPAARIGALALFLSLSVLCAKAAFATGDANIPRQLVIREDAAEKGVATLAVPYIEDRSGTNSVVQANVQFNRLRAAGQQDGSRNLVLGTRAGFFWIDLSLVNHSPVNKWWFSLETAQAGIPSPVRSMTLYDMDVPDLRPVASWPDTRQAGLASQVAVPLDLPLNTQKKLLLLVETWNGIDATLVPHLRTQANVAAIALETSRKTSLLWLIAGAVFGVGMVQLLLTRQAVQGALAVNALIVGLAVFYAGHSGLLPLAGIRHPVLLPMALTVLLGAGASFMLWTANRRYGVQSLFSLLPLLVNILAFAFVALRLDPAIAQLGSVENLPRYLLTLTGILMVAVTLVQGFSTIHMYWFLPAWLALASIPWLGIEYPYAVPVVYLLLLAVAGIASIFWQWRTRDSETEATQKRLRQELRNLKEKFQQENDNWRKKMDSQRDMLNELRMREQQRSSELEIAKKTADEANKAKSDFLAIISHEIRTPMNGIMGILEILNQTPMNEKQREYIDVIKNSGDTMLTLLNDILDYSKIEKGMIDLENVPFSLRKLVQSVATLMSGRARDKGISVQVVIDEALPDNLSADPQRIRQILLNLVSNAIKFTDQGSVTLRVTPLGDVSRQKDIPIRFEIIDTGIGISQEAQEKLFQAYVQADASISRRFGGTGLGLNICKMLVNAMKGQLGVISEEGKGSTFWFEIPLDQVDDTLPAPDAKTVTAPQSGRALSILVIDDNDINLKITSSLLEMDGHHVVIANGGEKALALAEKERFDLIFVDILMPGMNGKTFLEKLRDNPHAQQADIPVFALTGMVERQAVDDIMALGVLGVLAKPITQDALRTAITRAYGHLERMQDNETMDLGKIMATLDTLSDEEKSALRAALTENSGTQNEALAVGPAVPAMTQKTEDTMTYLNMAILGELKASLPAETVQEIFGDLIVKAKELTTQIEEAATQSELAELGEIAHNLKGMAGNFGLQGLMDHSGAIERAVRANDRDTATILVKDSRRILDNSLAALEQWLSS